MLPLAETTVAGALGLAAGAGFYAGMWPTSQWFGPTVLCGKDAQECALTFDDGPNDRYTQEILEFLANYHARATFFMLGDYVRQRPLLAREVLAAGHLIGNHTMSHPNLLYASAKRVRQQLQDCSHSLEDALGAPVRYMRPPYGGGPPPGLGGGAGRGRGRRHSRLTARRPLGPTSMPPPSRSCCSDCGRAC